MSNVDKNSSYLTVEVSLFDKRRLFFVEVSLRNLKIY